MLAQRSVRGVDHAHGEHREEGGKGGERQRREARPGREVEPYDGQVDRKRKSYGHHVPVPPHAPADHPQAEHLEPRNSLAYRDHDEGCDQRRVRPESPERQRHPRDDVGQYEERYYWVSSHHSL